MRNNVSLSMQLENLDKIATAASDKPSKWQKLNKSANKCNYNGSKYSKHVHKSFTSGRRRRQQQKVAPL